MSRVPPIAELVAAIYAAPADDAPRVVLADVLQRAGDPHGELIALQLAAPSRDPKLAKRIAALIAKHRATITPPRIWRALAVTSVRFARGFPVAGMLAPRSARDLAQAIGADGWQTFETLDLGPAIENLGSVERTRLLALVHHPVMRHLARVGPLDVAGTELVVGHGKPLPWRALAIRVSLGPDAALVDTLARAATVFPHLEHLALRVTEPTFVAIAAAAPWLRRLTRLTVAGVVATRPRARAAARRLGLAITKVPNLDTIFATP